MRTRGEEVQNPENFADVIYGRPLTFLIPTFAIGVLEIPQVALVALPAAVVIVARTLSVVKFAYF